MEVTALGMIETIGLVTAIEAADAGLKAADVRLLGTDYVRGGLVMVRFEGEVAAVQSAVDAGTLSAQRIGHVISSHVIPRAMPEVFCMLASDVSVGPGKRHNGGCASCGGCEGGRRELEALKKAQNAEKATQTDAEPAKTADLKAETVVSKTETTDLNLLTADAQAEKPEMKAEVTAVQVRSTEIQTETALAQTSAAKAKPEMEPEATAAQVRSTEIQTETAVSLAPAAKATPEVSNQQVTDAEKPQPAEKEQHEAEKPSGQAQEAATASGKTPDNHDFSTWKVVQLRHYVRQLPGFPMSPNEIRFANKTSLLEALEVYMKGKN